MGRKPFLQDKVFGEVIIQLLKTIESGENPTINDLRMLGNDDTNQKRLHKLCYNVKGKSGSTHGYGLVKLIEEHKGIHGKRAYWIPDFEGLIRYTFAEFFGETAPKKVYQSKILILYFHAFLRRVAITKYWEQNGPKSPHELMQDLVEAFAIWSRGPDRAFYDQMLIQIKSGFKPLPREKAIDVLNRMQKIVFSLDRALFSEWSRELELPEIASLIIDIQKSQSEYSVALEIFKAHCRGYQIRKDKMSSGHKAYLLLTCHVAPKPTS